MNSSVKAAPLEDLMVAMDVVDTLRHQQHIAARELDSEGRRERLLQRLRDLYDAQGIEVPDHVLEEGIQALEEERFQYQPPPSNWQTKLAHLWVSRTRWGKPVGFLAVLGSLFGGVYVATDVLPERQLRAGLPEKLQAVVQGIEQTAKIPELVTQAKYNLDSATTALAENRLQDATAIFDDMQQVQRLLQSSYTVRVVARPGEKSGVWRIPNINEAARNYYLIVEAVDDKNKPVKLDILDEETNQRKRASTWGLRVNEETFFKVASDKKDDGIIQNNIIGEKPVGLLRPKFSIPTTGGTITNW